MGDLPKKNRATETTFQVPSTPAPEVNDISFQSGYEGQNEIRKSKMTQTDAAGNEDGRNEEKRKYVVRCPICYRDFPKSEIQSHYEITHMAKSFDCPACKLKLASEYELYSHFKRIHPIPEEKDDSTQNALKSVGLFALKTAAISGAVLGGVALAVPAMGFTAGGVAAGSLAAGFQSTFLGGTIASGSLFATLQSVGAAGLAASTQVGVVAGSAVVAARSTFKKPKSKK